MSNSLNQNTGADCEILSLAQLEAQRRPHRRRPLRRQGRHHRLHHAAPVRRLSPGNGHLNPWIGQPYPTPFF